jgi:hypothetical protein
MAMHMSMRMRKDSTVLEECLITRLSAPHNRNLKHRHPQYRLRLRAGIHLMAGVVGGVGVQGVGGLVVVGMVGGHGSPPPTHPLPRLTSQCSGIWWAPLILESTRTND